MFGFLFVNLTFPSKRHYEVCELLLAAGADPELHTATGCCGTALHLAAALGDLRHPTLTCWPLWDRTGTRLVMMVAADW